MSAVFTSKMGRRFFANAQAQAEAAASCLQKMAAAAVLRYSFILEVYSFNSRSNAGQYFVGDGSAT